MRAIPRATVGAIGCAAALLGMSACGTTYAPSARARPTIGAVAIRGLGPVLSGASGRTLYYLGTETAGSIKCTAGCTSTWQPYVVAKGVRPTEAAGMRAQVGTTRRPDARTQVTVNGHPVYFFAGDSARGQANGQGADGTWFVLRAGAETSTNPSTITSSPYHY